MSSSNEFAIECANLGRVYTSRSLFGPKREVVALSEVSIQIPAGLVFGLLGPNGAGKTTTVRILATLLTPTTGTARVLGYDVVRQAGQVRRHIGFILGGDRGLYGRLTGKQNLRYFGALNHMNPREANCRSEDLLARVGLTEAGNTLVEGYSRGMRQRLHIARGLLTDPSVLFMDEPTIGLDPMAAQELRQYIPELTSQGKTIPRRAQPWVATMVRTIYQQPSPDEVHAQLDRVTDQLQNRFPQVASLLDEAGPDVLAFSNFPLAHWKKIWSNNPQERLNKEIRRRTDWWASSLTGRPCAASLAPSWLSNTTNGPSASEKGYSSNLCVASRNSPTASQMKNPASKTKEGPAKKRRTRRGKR